jgi:hypothetical protein
MLQFSNQKVSLTPISDCLLNRWRPRFVSYSKYMTTRRYMWTWFRSLTIKGHSFTTWMLWYNYNCLAWKSFQSAICWSPKCLQANITALLLNLFSTTISVYISRQLFVHAMHYKYDLSDCIRKQNKKDNGRSMNIIHMWEFSNSKHSKTISWKFEIHPI